MRGSTSRSVVLGVALALSSVACSLLVGVPDDARLGDPFTDAGDVGSDADASVADVVGDRASDVGADVSTADVPDTTAPDAQDSGIVDPEAVPSLVHRWMSTTGVTGNPVSQWNDLVGAAHATASGSAQPKTSTSPNNGQQEILFDGVANRMTTAAFALAPPYTLALVVRQPSWALTACIMDSTTTFQAVLSQGGGGGVSSGGVLCGYGGNAANGSANVGGNGDPGSTSLVIVEQNGAASSIQVNGGPSTTGTFPVHALTGLSFGGYGNATGFANVAIQDVAAFSGLLPDATKAGLFAWAHAKYGVARAWTKRLFVLGDSIPAAYGVTASEGWVYRLLAALAGTWGSLGDHGSNQFANNAVSGSRLVPTVNNAVPLTVGQAMDNSFDRVVVVVAAGTNDVFIDGVDDTTMRTRASTVASTIRSQRAGTVAKLGIQTILPRNPSGAPANAETVRKSYNAYLVANFASLGYDFVIDPTTDPAFSASGAWSDAGFFQGDGTHPNAAGHARLETVYEKAIGSLP